MHQPPMRPRLAGSSASCSPVAPCAACGASASPAGMRPGSVVIFSLITEIYLKFAFSAIALITPSWCIDNIYCLQGHAGGARRARPID